MKVTVGLGMLLVATLVGEVTAATAILPEGPGKALVTQKCTTCHTTSEVVSQHLDKKQWAEKIDEMTARGADVSNSERAIIADYLSSQLGSPKHFTASK